jgi:hypothetical protein
MPKRIEQIVVGALVVGLGMWLTVARAQAPARPPEAFEATQSESFPVPASPKRPSDVLPRAAFTPADPRQTIDIEAPSAAPANSSLAVEPTPIDSRTPTLPQRMRQVRRFAPVEYLVMEPIPEAELVETQRIKALEPKLKLPKGEPAKEAAVKELSGLLEKSFDRDLDRREKQISQVEERIKRLRDQIERRKTAKKEILNLRLQTMVNEAEGLGFPSPDGDGQPLTPARALTPVFPQAGEFRPTPAPAVPWSPSPREAVPVPGHADDLQKPSTPPPATAPQRSDAKIPAGQT